MSRNRIGAAVAIVGAALVASPVAAASGGGGGSGGPGGGGGTTTCRPFVTQVGVGHADSGESGIGVGATVSDCTSLSQQRIHLNVSVPGSTTVPYNMNLALKPGTVLTMNASPIGSTPGELQYSKTYTVIATLTDTSTTPATVLATTSSSVTMAAGPVR